MAKEEYENYLKFIDEALELAKEIPRHFSKFSNKIYCNHQKFAIIILMQKLKLTTRGVISFLKSNPTLCMHFGLFRIPVHTTVVRFFAKAKNLIGLLLKIRQANIVAVDSTGFELEAKSFYYRNVFNSDKKQKTKRYIKLSICIDTDKQLILSYKIRKKLRHDTKDFKYLLKDIACEQVAADKGYDDKKIRKFVLDKLNAVPQIPFRKNSGRNGSVNRTSNILFDEKIYHQRSKIETVFSVIKRRYGSVLRNKSYATQQAELISKLITYNLDRKLNYLLLIIEGCTRALKRKIYILSKTNLTRLKMDVAITKMSSKGQVVIPSELREEIHEGEKLIVIKDGNRLIIKKVEDLDNNLKEDLIFAKRTEEAWRKYERGEFTSSNKEDFLKELKKW